MVGKERLGRKIESPGGGRGGPSVAYHVWEARLLIRPREVVSLERSTDEAHVRRIAETVAIVLETSIHD